MYLDNNAGEEKGNKARKRTEYNHSIHSKHNHFYYM